MLLIVPLLLMDTDSVIAKADTALEMLEEMDKEMAKNHKL